MYQIGDRVLYGIHGVCRVADMEEKVIDRKMLTYLVLEPEGQTGARFLVPTHNPAAMGKVRTILTPDELKDLMCSEKIRKDGWISEENARKNLYRQLISSGDREQLMQMVFTLYRRKAQQLAAGKRMHLCDDNFLRDAEKLLAGEVSVVMDMEPEAAKKYIRTMLKEDA